MISKGSCYPVDGSLEVGPESKAEGFVCGVSHDAARPDGFTGRMRQLEVSIYCLKTRRPGHDKRGKAEAVIIRFVMCKTVTVKLLLTQTFF